MTTEEGIAEFDGQLEAYRKQELNLLTSKFANDIADLETEDDINKVLEEALDSRNGDISELKVKLDEIKSNRLHKVAADKADAAARTETNAANNTPSSTVVTPPAATTTSVNRQQAPSSPSPTWSVNINGRIFRDNDIVRLNDDNTHYVITGQVTNADGTLSAILDNNPTNPEPFSNLIRVASSVKMEQFSELARDISIASDNIMFSEQDKSMWTIDGSNTINRKYSASDVTRDPNSRPGSNKYTIFGTKIDDLSRDVFNHLFETDGDISSFSKSSHISQDGLSEQVVDKWIEHIVDVYKAFNKEGYTVFANDIRVFDTESGIGGTLDFLLVNKLTNDIIVLDLKALSLGGSKNAYNYGAKDEIKKHLTQISIYASILYKQHSANHEGLRLSKVGIMVGKTVLDNGNPVDINPIDETNVAIEAISEVYGVPADSIEIDNGIVLLPYSNNILTKVQPFGQEKSVYELLKLGNNNKAITTMKELELVIAKVFESFNNSIYGENKDIEAQLQKILYQLDNSSVGNVLNQEASVASLRASFAEEIRKLFELIPAEHQVTEDMSLANALNKFVVYAEKKYKKHLLETSLEGSTNNSRPVDSSIITSEQIVIFEYQKRIVELITEMMNNNSSINITSSLELASILNSYRKIITDDVVSKLDASSIFELVYMSHRAINKELSIEELTDTMRTLLQVVMPSMKLHLLNEMGIKLKTYKVYHNEEIGKLNEITGEITLTDGTKSLVWGENTEYQSMFEDSQRMFNIYRDLYLSIGSVAVYNNNRYSKVTIDKMTPEDIVKHMEFIDSINQERYKGLTALPNDNNKVQDEVNSDSLVSHLDSIKVGKSVQLTMLEGGNIGVKLSKTSTPMFIIPNTKSHVMGIKVVNEYGGFEGFSPKFRLALETILSSKKTSTGQAIDNSDLLYYLKDLNLNRLLLENSKNESDKNYNQRQLENIVNELIRADRNNETLSNEKAGLLEVIRAFNNNEESNDITVDRLKDILNVLFYNRFLTNYDSYVPSIKDIKNRVDRFNKVAKIANVKYNLMVSPKGNLVSDNGVINKVYNSSVLINSSNEVLRLEETIQPISIDGSSESRIEFATNVNGSAILSRNGSAIDSTKVNLSDKTSKIYVLLKGVDGKLIPFPTRANTVANSYSRDGNGDTAVEYITDTIISILSAKQVGEGMSGRDKQSAYLQSINKAIQASGLNNILIYNKDLTVGTVEIDGESSQLKHSYFTIYPSIVSGTEDSDTKIELIVEFTTIDNSDNQSVETYHKMVIGEESGTPTYHYGSVTKSSGSTFNSAFDSLKSKRGTKVNSINEISKILSNSVGGLLRQTYLDKGMMMFNQINEDKSIEAINEFRDPITGEQFTSAYDYALATDSIYSRVDAVKNKDGEIVTNLDTFGTAKLGIDIGVINVTNLDVTRPDDAEGNIHSLTLQKLPEFAGVFSVMNSIEEAMQSENLYDGVTNINSVDNQNQNAIASTHMPKNQSSPIIRNIYTNNLLYYVGDRGINNSAFALLHEKMHKIILLAAHQGNYNLSPEEASKVKSGIAKLNNQNVLAFVEDFTKNFTIFAKDRSQVLKLVQQLGLIEVSNSSTETEAETSVIDGFINDILKVFGNQISQDVQRAELVRQSQEASNSVNGDAFAQELFGYYTNPIVMAALSAVTTDGKFYSKDNSNKGTFIDKLIDMLIRLVNSISKAINGESLILDRNYSKVAKNMLSDLYHQLSNGIIIEESVVEESTVEQELDSSTLTEDSFSDNIFDSSIINSAFSHLNNESFKDDSNYVIC